jgi:hypothetical protein
MRYGRIHRQRVRPQSSYAAPRWIIDEAKGTQTNQGCRRLPLKTKFFRGKRRTWTRPQHGKSQCQAHGGRYEAKDHLGKNRRVFVISALSDYEGVVNHQTD